MNRVKDLASVVYSRLPIHLQNVAISCWGMWERRQRYGKHFHECLEWLSESQFHSAGEVEEYQTRRLQWMVRHSYDTVPFYRDRFDQFHLRPEDIRGLADLHKLPVLTKAEVRVQQDAMVSRAFSTGELRTHLTSGTTGTPLRIRITPEAAQMQWAVWWRHRGRFGLKFGDKFLTFGARLPVISSRATKRPWRRNLAFNQVYLSTYHLTPQTLEGVVDWLQHEEFAFYAGYPSAMFVLANYVRERGIDFRNGPRWVVTGSDALTPAFEQVIAEQLKSNVTDQYGSMEACGNFARCEEGKYHLDHEMGIVELQPIPGVQNSRLRRIVFTGIANPAMPFLRYDIGDIAVVSEGPCNCGRHTVTIDRIEGRTEDFIRTPDGRMAIGMNQVFEWAPGLREAQIRQDQIDEIVVRLVPGPGYSDSDRQIVERELRRRLGPVIRISYELVRDIERTASGKMRLVVSTLPPMSDAEREHRTAVNAGLSWA